MWKSLKVDNGTVFMRCTVTNNHAECILHDLHHSWISVLTLAEVQEQVKLLNKRIKFDAATAYSTLQHGVPEEVSWMVEPVVNAGDDANVGVDGPECTLKLKYRVRKFYFNFSWLLRQQPQSQLYSMALNETSGALQTLLQAVFDLRETVRRKEEEIDQYKREGAVLRRVTVATQSFDFAQLNERIASSSAFARMLKMAAEQLQPTEQSEAAVTAVTAGAETLIVRALASPTRQVKLEEVKKSPPKRNPRNLKRKAQQAEKMHLARTLNARKRHIEYESSQSQNLLDSQEVAVQTALEGDPCAPSVSAGAVTDEQVNALALSKKKSNCAATKSKRKMSGERDVLDDKSQVRLVNALPAQASMHRCNVTPEETTPVNSIIALPCQSLTTEADDKKRRNVVFTIKLSNTRELDVYIDNILNELDKIDQQLKETA